MARPAAAVYGALRCLTQRCATSFWLPFVSAEPKGREHLAICFAALRFKEIFFAAVSLTPSIVLADVLGLDAEFLRRAEAVEAGSFQFYPALASKAGYDTNMFESHRHVRDSAFSQIAPELSVMLPLSFGAIQALYQADRIQYSASSADDFTDHLLLTRFRFTTNDRHRFAGDASWNPKHEARGTGLSEGFDPVVDTGIPRPDELTDRRAHLNYEYGALTARGNLRFALDALQRDYTNHAERTQYFDRDEVGGGVTFLWRVLPRSSMLFEARARDVNYDLVRPGDASLDSREYAYLTGVEWQASEQTRASFRIGHKSKNFLSSQRNDSSQIAWEVGASWAPRTYSIFSADFSRSPAETNGYGDFIDRESYAFTWKHKWSDRLRSELGAYYDENIYRAAVDQDRNTQAFKCEIDYRMYRWLTWQLSYAFRNRDSDSDIFNMTRNQYALGVQVSL